MEHNMILSASGWRKEFAQSGNEQDTDNNIGLDNKRLCALIGETFAQYIILKTAKKNPVVAIGMDSRPTGKEIAHVILKVLKHYGLDCRFLGISSAPEIMAYARTVDGFLYISASHNPVAHNGIKFGLSDGGVLESGEAKILIENFKNKCLASDCESYCDSLLAIEDTTVDAVYNQSSLYKQKALETYRNFITQVITGTQDKVIQKSVTDEIKSYLSKNPLTLVCDLNGSSRALSIDKEFLPSLGIDYVPFNDECGKIAHEIIPEPENLIYCADKMQQLQETGTKSAVLGFMPDCDGDRGNLVYFDTEAETAKPIEAQKVFALCVVAEGCYDIWLNKDDKIKRAVAVNCPTSMRIDDITKALGEELFRGEVGEANIVNLARAKRQEGYSVRILGEGSNGGNITYPSSVRDPIATVAAIIKLLTIRDSTAPDGSIREGLFHIWCQKSGQMNKYSPNFNLNQIISTLPVYTTTGVSEKRAVLNVRSEDKGLLKQRFKSIFENQWQNRKTELSVKYGIKSYRADITNGINEVHNPESWNNGNGGLKIRFLDKDNNNLAFIWMRPSGTEKVFRVMCDVKGDNREEEKDLLEWETQMIQEADQL